MTGMAEVVKLQYMEYPEETLVLCYSMVDMKNRKRSRNDKEVLVWVLRASSSNGYIHRAIGL